MNNRQFLGTIMKFCHVHRKSIHKINDEANLFHGQLPILEVVDDLKECTQREIAHALKVSPSSIATSIKRLEKTGFINKVIGEEDLRYTYISLTPKGKKTLDEILEKCAVFDALTLAGVSLYEQRLVIKIMEQMILNIESTSNE